jgi:hypothetical protein
MEEIVKSAQRNKLQFFFTPNLIAAFYVSTSE